MQNGSNCWPQSEVVSMLQFHRSISKGTLNKLFQIGSKFIYMKCITLFCIEMDTSQQSRELLHVERSLARLIIFCSSIYTR